LNHKKKTKPIDETSINSVNHTSSAYATESDIIMNEINSAVEEETKPDSITTIVDKSDKSSKVTSKDEISHFVATYPSVYPPDWTLSAANDYKKPETTDLDAIDSSLSIENERHFSLCLSPFSREFYITTGYSKLQVPDDYLELISVIVWHNRQRKKKRFTFPIT
jgi:hypothetical protein